MAMSGFQSHPAAPPRASKTELKYVHFVTSRSDVRFVDWIASTYGISRSEALRRVIGDVRKQYAVAGIYRLDEEPQSSEKPTKP